ncbi:MAG: transcription elongation factor GreA [Methylocystis sp.]|nr:transcription elongation factor GreA [Methylocystis sp.]
MLLRPITKNLFANSIDIGLDSSFEAAFAKSQLGSGAKVPRQGAVFVSVRDADKPRVLVPVKLLAELGFSVQATGGTARFLSASGIEAQKVNKVSEGRPHIVDAIKNGSIQLVFNTTEGAQALADDGEHYERTRFDLKESGRSARRRRLSRIDSERATDMVDKVPMTAAGYVALDEELRRRQQINRPLIIQHIAEARSHGDLSENAEYHAAKEAQALNEGRIAELEDKLSRAEVIDVSKLGGNTVKFGATVTVVDEDTEEEKRYQIVGEPEADVKNGRVSIASPIARALIGKKAGDTVEVRTPGGGKSYEILKVAFG